MICCLWHDELFSLIPIARQLKVAAIVSPSRDGDMLARILASKNVGAVRGSSRHGGMNALLSMTHLMQRELVHAVITVDGPAGPWHKVKNGALFLANNANAHILPVRIFHRNAVQLPTWDKFQVPLPFSSALIRFGVPWENGKEAVPDLEESTLAAARSRLEHDMEALASDCKGKN
ncbi:MAG: DUF374 domain-containing protein [Mailhella sp.]|nr:DUF374 domain-containing protein [Mailhella sp.]